MRIIKSWLEKIELLDAISAARSKIVMFTAISILAIMTIFTPVRRHVSPYPYGIFIVLTCAYATLLLAAYRSWRKPQNRLSGYLILLAAFSIFAAGSISFGGLRTPGSYFLVLLPFIASFIIDKRASWIFFKVCVGFVIIVFVLKKKDVLPPMTHSLLEHEDILRLFVLILNLGLSFCFGVIAEKVPRTIIAELMEAYESHPAAIAKIDRFGRVIYVNRAFVEMFGKVNKCENVQRLLTRHFRDVPTTFFEKNWSMNSEFQLQASNGKTFVLSFKKNEIMPNAGLLFFTDITLVLEKANLEKILSEKNAKEKLIATFNHEINNPLMIAMVHIKRISKNTEVSEDSVHKIDVALKRIDNVLKEIKRIDHL